MPLAVPALDDRKFQDILDEARRMIPSLCPEWTDHNLSDPGITLLELFAWMTDLLLFRLNRVPDKNYLKFLELIGIKLEPARAAVAELAFRLTAAQPEDVVIPRGTGVGTVRTEATEAITFATEDDLTIRVPKLSRLLTWSVERGHFQDYEPVMEQIQREHRNLALLPSRDLRSEDRGPGIFSRIPCEDDALYLGFSNDLRGHLLGISMRCGIEGVGVVPDDAPIAWECWDALDGAWVKLAVECDTTAAFNQDGVVILRTPATAAPSAVNGDVAFWVRCRSLKPRPDQHQYDRTPRPYGISVESLGGLVMASHTTTITGEVLGASDGTPGQTFKLQSGPILPRQAGETLEVEDESGELVPWTEISHFGSSHFRDRHYVVDDVSGTIELGPRMRSPNGRHTQYGSVPPAGRRLRFSRYRTGGGVAGNVGAETLTVLKSSIPYILWVTNFAPAAGGTDPEDLDHARWRGPDVLRASERAVTVEDFERLARQATSGVGRARCVVARPGEVSDVAPGEVRVLLVPALTAVDGPIPKEHLEVPRRVREQVHAFLDERRLMTTELTLATPEYVGVSVSADLRVRAGFDPAQVQAAALTALYRHLHPMVGGPDGTGWPFGREIFIADIYALLKGVRGVDAVVSALMLRVADPRTGATDESVTRIGLPPNALLCSHQHSVSVAS